ncbi:SERTA domain-containing protein 3 [Paramarasmius palmivorus]|uniref:SERTA domain-containing protein 3 n=1 Tax=Paramarasmius palmivorus TaxID=297713 RepID=A0AAW0B3K0_9AGAR
MPRQHGARLAYLESKVPEYFAAVQGGYGPEFLALVVAGYLRRFRPDKGEEYEPTAAELAAIDDDNAEDEEWLIEPIRKEDEVVEKFLERLEEFKQLKKVVASKIDQVERWMRYCYRKHQELKMKESDAFRKLLTKLTGLETGPGRRRVPYVEWGRANPELADELVRNHLSSKNEETTLRANAIAEGWSAIPATEQDNWNQKALNRFEKDCSDGILGAPYPGYLLWAQRYSLEVDQRVQVAVAENARTQKYVKKGADAYVAVRQGVLKQEFAKLSSEDQQKWREVAQENHNERVAAYNQLKAAPYSRAPEDRQKAIERIGAFMTPILEELSEATGWNFSMFGGGPEPADGGRLNTVALHIGLTAGPVSSTFGGLFRPQIKQTINNLYGVAECRSRAMPNPGLPREAEEEDPTHRIVHDTIEDQGGRGDTSQAAEDKASKPAPSAVKRTSVPEAIHPSSNASSKVAKSAVKPIPVAKPITPSSTVPSASSSRSGSHARIRPPTTPPRLAPQGSTTPAASAKGARSTPSDTVKGKEAVRSTTNTVREQSRASSPISVPRSSPPSSPSMPPQSLPPPSPQSIRSSPDPQPEPEHVHEASGASNSPIQVFSSPPAPSPRTYKGRKRAVESDSSPVKPGPSTKRSKSTFVGVVIPVPAAGGSSATSSRKKRGQDNEEPSTSVPLSAPVDSSSSSQPAPTSKRRKTESNRGAEDPIPEHVPHMVSSPAGCAEYAQTVLSICHEAQMDRQFRDLVVNWLYLDGKANYTGAVRLSATHRPPDIGFWIARARPVGYKTKKMQNLQTFADEFEAWYKHCAPSWRKASGPGIRLSREEGKDWTSMAKFGINGIVNFVVGLAWWKLELKRLPCRTPRERQFKAGQFALYMAALDEVDYTFRSLKDAGY